MVGKIKKASDLTSTQFTIDKLVYGSKKKKLFWVVNLNEARFLAESQAIVKAGIDLNELSPDDVRINGESIEIHLPHVRIITFSYPADRFKESLYSKNFAFNKISVVEKEKLFRDAELDIRESLKYMGIRKTTEDKTRLLFEALLRNLGYNEIYMDFKEGELIAEPDLNIVQ
ncbi:DUF4230 domain-containing protein [Marinifilum sp.]|uniref:DUF4230 domain-containing protein n=1 Tax=Marinifilum sp. TaxID=2033137 RepID=UPI003BAA9535